MPLIDRGRVGSVRRETLGGDPRKVRHEAAPEISKGEE